ncbi:hypothetical protein V1517DRAFT_357936 [Lipomyces orientalis]|uniref:Uncharacterized protein n=1 Tax=Lipomyces orientalis TaxID=1233043 RepID=A0ACC3TDS1_9ASCO
MTMMHYRAKMGEYDGDECSDVVLPDLKNGEQVTHDECYFNSNDDVSATWIESGESIIKKGQGLGLMVSDFYCACRGSIQFEGQYAREIIEPCKNSNGFWGSEDWSDNLVSSWKSLRGHIQVA